jgi:glycosyltransferase involved in cell wall biosynthesis
MLLEQHVPQDRIAVIPNGIESQWILNEEQLTARFTRRKGHSKRFVMIGRNDFCKGLHILQQALAGLVEPIELHLIGDWPSWDTGIHQVVHHGLIRDKGQLMGLLDECDVLLLPSLSEGMPTVILEAMARGLSVIATDVGACSELVSSDRLIPPGDASQLARAIAGGSVAPERYDLEQFTFVEIAKLTLMEFEKEGRNI